MILPEKLESKNLRQLSAFFCQGLESSFICHLAILSKEYSFKVRSLEHDGMIISPEYPLGPPIPTKAIEEAKRRSGFEYCTFEEKGF